MARPMKLITKELEKEFAKIGRQETVTDPIVVAKFFNPAGAETWFATEYDPENEVCFGYICTQPDYHNEFGYFSIAEMREIRIKPFGLGIERDIYFGQKRLSEALKELHAPMPSFWKKYIDYNKPENIDVDELLEQLASVIELYCEANNLTLSELRDLDEDNVNQSLYDEVCDECLLYDAEKRSIATEIMRYHFWDTLDNVTGGLYD